MADEKTGMEAQELVSNLEEINRLVTDRKVVPTHLNDMFFIELAVMRDALEPVIGPDAAEGMYLIVMRLWSRHQNRALGKRLEPIVEDALDAALLQTQEEVGDGVVHRTIHPVSIYRIKDDGYEVDITNTPAERQRVEEILPAVEEMMDGFNLREITINLGLLKFTFKRGK